MAGIWAKGTVLTLGSAVAELTSISGPSESADTIDVSSHDSTGDYREFVGGFIDGGEVTVEGNVKDKAQLDLFKTTLGTKSSGATIVYPTTPAITITFDCITTAFELDAPFEDRLSFTATLKVTGKPAITVAAE